MYYSAWVYAASNEACFFFLHSFLQTLSSYGAGNHLIADFSDILAFHHPPFGAPSFVFLEK